MKEHPIIFNGEMIRAIMAGKKTQTRRVVRLPKYYQGLTHDDIGSFWVAHCLNCKECKNKGKPCGRKFWQIGDDISPQQYHAGDRLWVRETFVLERWLMEFGDPVIPTDRPSKYYESDPTNEFDESYWQFPHFQATDPTPELCYEGDSDSVGEPTCKWRPSIFMPRWASRITLEITGVRVERVQEISANDACAEGVLETDFWKPKDVAHMTFEDKFWDDDYFWTHYPQMAYSELWNSINAKRGYSWESNPWVWVIEFKRVI